MKNEKLFRAIGDIGDDKIIEADANRIESKFTGRAWRKWGMVAACLAIALMITIPLLQRETPENPGETILEPVGPEVAILYDDLNIYYVDEENTLACESVFIRHTAEDIFSKWAQLNRIADVELVEYLLSSNGVETIHGDPNDPDTAVSYTVGDYFTITITLSLEFAHYADGENGLLLVESLKATFIEYHKNIEIDEFNIIINEQ